jgi:hypothetical protein
VGIKQKFALLFILNNFKTTACAFMHAFDAIQRIDELKA